MNIWLCLLLIASPLAMAEDEATPIESKTGTLSDEHGPLKGTCQLERQSGFISADFPFVDSSRGLMLMLDADQLEKMDKLSRSKLPENLILTSTPEAFLGAVATAEPNVRQIISAFNIADPIFEHSQSQHQAFVLNYRDGEITGFEVRLFPTVKPAAEEQIFPLDPKPLGLQHGLSGPGAWAQSEYYLLLSCQFGVTSKL